MKGFTITCNGCGKTNTINKDYSSSVVEGDIDFEVTEDCSWMGCTVETKDIICWNCNNEVNL